MTTLVRLENFSCFLWTKTFKTNFCKTCKQTRITGRDDDPNRFKSRYIFGQKRGAKPSGFSLVYEGEHPNQKNCIIILLFYTSALKSYYIVNPIYYIVKTNMKC